MRALIPTHAVEDTKVWNAHLDSVCSEGFAATGILVDESAEYALTAFLWVGVRWGQQRLPSSNGGFLKARRQHERRASDRLRLVSRGQWVSDAGAPDATTPVETSEADQKAIPRNPHERYQNGRVREGERGQRTPGREVESK
jgi:hypothetical protein